MREAEDRRNGRGTGEVPSSLSVEENWFGFRVAIAPTHVKVEQVRAI